MSILIAVLNDAELINNFGVKEWSLLKLEAKSANLVGPLFTYLKCKEKSIPEYVSWHFESSLIIANKQRRQALREIKDINLSLAAFKDVTFLKGAAYIIHHLDCSVGRLFSDIDLLVNKAELAQVERALYFNGWLQTEVEDYDEKYYREWMHEIPPMQHVSRGTVLDVHHNILPKTNQLCLSPSLFEFEDVDLEDIGRIKTLSKNDMFIHCAVHLFTESEFHNGLRDLWDLHCMIIQFSKEKSCFIDDVYTRSCELGLESYVLLAFRYTNKVFFTPLNNDIRNVLDNERFIQKFCWDFAFLNIFKPDAKACRTWKTPIATFLTYWRGHLIRMPLRLLAPHLMRKLWMQFRDALDKTPKEEAQNLP
ncbi:nucleotidyltransferase family protein [Catenovulum maritimum]|uniref:Nucleotidyltransferase family protein n=1 Tax=Catenovulum maritimum TaxID=1513271 RepID=A0A0J8GVC4_9ALTE|nr:nucleotidyltransferase family protein [Catenovulum maritimum]KMT64623.1 hypothetical protein XM47_13350 [Catenovulum maritimum]